MLAAEGLVELLPNRGAVVAQLSRAGRGRHLRGASPGSKASRANWRRSASPRPSWPRSARCTTRCWPPSRAATCPPTTGSTRRSTRLINAAARNPVLTQTWRNVNARLQALRFRSNFDEAKWQRAVKEHEQMVELLAARDAAGLRALLVAAPAAQARRRARADARTASSTPARMRLQRMNAPLPPGSALARRACRRWRAACAPRPQGEVLFDAASRGRYATDASIYQIMPVGVFVPKTRARRRHRAGTSRAS